MSDVYIKLRLSFHQRNMLKFLAERGGECEYNFGGLRIEAAHMTEEEKANMVRQVEESIREMGDPLRLGVVTITPIVDTNPNKVLLRLTDAGRQVIDQMGLVVKPQSLVLDMSKGGAEVLGTGEDK